jgi:hypothetical protein
MSLRRRDLFLLLWVSNFFANEGRDVRSERLRVTILFTSIALCFNEAISIALRRCNDIFGYKLQNLLCNGLLYNICLSFPWLFYLSGASSWF